MCGHKPPGNKLAKFHGKILSLSENIAKRFRGPTFLTHTVVCWVYRLFIIIYYVNRTKVHEK